MKNPLIPLLPILLLVAAQQADPPREGKLDFYAEVRPILSVHCFRCHDSTVHKGGLRLDTREGVHKGGDSGESAIKLILGRVTTKDREERMPSKAEPLPAALIETLRKWIAQGAPWPDAPPHWAFQPLQSPTVPVVKNPGWVKTPVDAFVARGHEARGLSPSAEASRRTLLRRVTLDLTGLPPTPEELDAKETYEQAVDRLLASTAYGERWGRHWLDLARWAESSGYEANAVRSASWRYRDYVIRSFNEDKPHDLFLRQQLAGDEMEPLTDENLVATGFLATGRLDNNQEDRAVQRNDHLFDITNASAAVLFGLSFGCAQCHDHKWDPITQADYYRLQGFFARGQVNPLVIQDPEAWIAYEKSIPPELEPAKALKRALLEGAKKKLSAANAGTSKAPDDQAAAKALGDDDKKLFAELDKKIQAIEKSMAEKPHAWGFASPATSPHALKTLPIKGFYPMLYEPAKLKEAKPRVLKRGDVHQPGPEVEPGWPAVLGPTPPGTWTRTALVERLTRPDHPLTARVWVNFVWQQHFGRGIVTTPGDFGLRGAKPIHPELLDWLASAFVARGWSNKRLHRWIVLSSTYRQSSAPNEVDAKVDPENRLLWRWSPRRLEAEAVRDSILAVSGELDRKMGGPSVVEDPKALRRTVYLLHKRHDLPDVAEFFDAPGAGESCPLRHVSTVSPQSLYLMNNPIIHARAKAFAARAGTPEQAFLLALGRPASASEHEAAKELDLVTLCHALLNLNEFVYLE